MSGSEAHALELIERVRAKPLRFRDDQITMAHGAGGKATLSLVEGLLAPALGLTATADASALGGVYLTTDSFVVKPIRFADARASLAPDALRPGDRILVSGPIGAHGVAIMLARGEFELEAPVESDTRSLWPAVDTLLDAAGGSLRCIRDATRGGVASVLNELARTSGVSVLVREAQVPVAPAVAGACEILGIDPMYVANEGTLVAFVAPEAAGDALAALRTVAGCEQAAEIGEVKTEPPGMVLVETGFGGKRVMDLLVGDPLPRIC
jgi:hydrogenase expression/formation protein HypE